MEAGLLTTFWVLAAGLVVAIPLRWRGRWRGRRRGRLGFLPLFAIAPVVAVLGAVIIHSRVRETLSPELAPWLDGVFAYSMLASLLGEVRLGGQPLSGTIPRMAFRLPGQVFLAGAMLSTGWLLLALPIRAVLWLLGLEGALEVLRFADWAPLALAIASVVTSARVPAPEVVRIEISKDGPDGLERVPVERHRRGDPPPLEREPLRLVQFTDTHLGPWQTVDKLRRHVETLVDRDPHLVLLTGDYLTRDTNGAVEALTEAFSPLRRLPGRCFAVYGNHDHEAPDVVRGALESNGVHLLVDEEATIETPVVRVQIVGSDFKRGEGRAEHLEALTRRHPRRAGHLRLLLLHDPSGFHELPAGGADLTLSGHTHGGQVGLVSLGLDWTVLTRSSIPDHGLFGRGSDRLYVHRGSGFYGFPMRVGVPGERSLLELVFDPARFDGAPRGTPSLLS